MHINTIEEADNYLKNMQAKAKNLIDKINSEESKKEDAKNAQRSLNMLRESFITDKKKNVKEKKVVTQNVDFSVGEEVLVKTMNQNGKILKIMPNNRIQVQTGILKLVVSTDDIVKIQKKKTNKFKNFAYTDLLILQTLMQINFLDKIYICNFAPELKIMLIL